MLSISAICSALSSSFIVVCIKIKIVPEYGPTLKHVINEDFSCFLAEKDDDAHRERQREADEYVPGIKHGTGFE